MADKPVFPSLLNIGEEKKKKEERERRKDPNFPWMPLGVAGGLGLGGLGAYQAGRGMGAVGEATFADFYDFMHKARGGAPSFKPWDWVKGKPWEANPDAVASFEADEAKGRYFDAIQPSEALLKARVSSLDTSVLQQGNDVISFTLNAEDMLGSQMGYFGLGATLMGEPLYEGGATGLDAMMGARSPRQNWWFKKLFPIDDIYAGHGTTKSQFGVDPTRGGPGKREETTTKHKLPGLARGEKIESSPGHKSDSQTDKSRLSGYVLPEALYRGTPETNPRHWKHHARKLRGLDFPNTGGAWLQQPRQQDLAEKHQHREVARWPHTDPNTGQDVGGYWGGVEGHYGGFSRSPAHAMEQLYLETYSAVDGSINKLGQARQYALQQVAQGLNPASFKEAYIDKFVELWSPVDTEGQHPWSQDFMPQQGETSLAARAKAQAALAAAQANQKKYLELHPGLQPGDAGPVDVTQTQAQTQALAKAVTEAETASTAAARPWTTSTGLLGAATATATKQPFVRRKIRNTASKIIDVVERRLAERGGQPERGLDPTWEAKYPVNLAALQKQRAADPLSATYNKKFVDQTPAIRHVLGLKDHKATAEAMHDVQRHAMKIQEELAEQGLNPLEVTKKIYESLQDPQNEQLGTIAQLASTGGGPLVFPLSAVAYRAIGEAMAVPGHVARGAKALSPYFKYIGAGMLGLGSIYGIHAIHKYFKEKRRFEEQEEELEKESAVSAFLKFASDLITKSAAVGDDDDKDDSKSDKKSDKPKAKPKAKAKAKPKVSNEPGSASAEGKSDEPSYAKEPRPNLTWGEEWDESKIDPDYRPYLDERQDASTRSSARISNERRKRFNNPSSGGFTYNAQGSRRKMRPGESYPNEDQFLFQALAKNPNYLTNPEAIKHYKQKYPGLIRNAAQARRENRRGGGQSIAQSWRAYSQKRSRVPQKEVDPQAKGPRAGAKSKAQGQQPSAPAQPSTGDAAIEELKRIRGVSPSDSGAASRAMASGRDGAESYKVRDIPGYSDDTVPAPYQNRTKSKSWLEPSHGDDTYGGQSAFDPAYRAHVKNRTDLANRNIDTYNSMGRRGGSLESRDASLEAMGLPSREEMARRHGSYGKFTKQRGGKGGHIDTTGLGGRMANLAHMRANQGPALQQRAARKQQEREQLDADVQAGTDRGHMTRVNALSRMTGLPLDAQSTPQELRDAQTSWRLQNAGRKQRRRTHGAISNRAVQLVNEEGYSSGDAMRMAQEEYANKSAPPKPRMSDSRARSNTQRTVTDLDRQIRQARSPRHKATLRGRRRIAQRRLDQLNDQAQAPAARAMAQGRQPQPSADRPGGRPETAQPVSGQPGAMGWPGGPTALPGDPKQTPPAQAPTSPPPSPTPKDLPKDLPPGKQHRSGMMERVPQPPVRPPARPSTGGDHLPPPVPAAPPTGAGSSPKLPPRKQPGPQGGATSGRGGIFSRPPTTGEPFEGPKPTPIKPRPQGVVGPKTK
jgi:hypothetical protein